jgi:D-alanyl-D-alanine carboxypeptidase
MPYDPVAMGGPVERVADFAKELLSLYGLPGLSLAVVGRDRPLGAAQLGSADLERGLRVGPDTLFELGSIGKSFTAVCLLLLHEQGRLDLHAPVASILLWFDAGPHTGSITVHHLLTHTAGIAAGSDVSADSRFDVWALREELCPAAPGRHHYYSNVGYRALGYVVEELTGRRYPEVVRDWILEPLGMESAEAAIANELRPWLAVGYERWCDDRPARRDDALVPAAWLETDTGDGSMAASALELGHYLRMLLNEGRLPQGRLLAPASFELLTQPAAESDDGWVYGYGLETKTADGRRLLRHEGSMPGFTATMLGDLAAGLGAAVLLNGPDEAGIVNRVADYALDVFRAEQAGRPPPELPSIDPCAVANADDFAGRWVSARGELVLEASSGGLELCFGDARVPLEPRREDAFLVPHPDLERFLLSFAREDGKATEAWHGAERYGRGAEPPPRPECPEEWRPYPGRYRAANPWVAGFRVVQRADALWIAYPWGREEPLAALGGGAFRVGAEAWSPEWVRFDAVAGGEALRATLSGCAYYRVSFP